MGQIASTYDVADGLQTTWNVLAQTRNRAAMPVLTAALRSSAVDIHAGAVRTAVRRKDADSHEQIIRLFATLGEPEQQMLCEAHREMPHRMAAALTAAILNGDAVLCENACRIILLCHDYDQFPVLVRAAENLRHQHVVQVNAAMLQLANRLLQDLSEPRSNIHQTRRNAFFLRRQVVRALERSVSDYARHQRLEILEAFLLVAPAGNEVLEKILQDTRHPCHDQALASLAASKVPAMIEQLVSLLHDATVPIGVLKIIAQRTDRRFLDLLLRGVKQPLPLRVLTNFGRLHGVVWLEGDRELLLELDGRAQSTAVEVATASSINHFAVFELLAMLLRLGATEARRAACRALAEFRSPEANALVVEALADPDSGVQAAAAQQLRERQLPDALPTLVRLLDAPSAEVRDAARSSLAEFNFVRYRAMFDLLDEKTLRTTGVLVNKVDPSSYFRLAEELTSPSASTRRRGIAMAIAMEAACDVRDKLIVLAEDEDVAVRLEAVIALGHCRGREVTSALQMATQDPHRTVREAAVASLARVRARSQCAGREAALEVPS